MSDSDSDNSSPDIPDIHIVKKKEDENNVPSVPTTEYFFDKVSNKAKLKNTEELKAQEEEEEQENARRVDSDDSDLGERKHVSAEEEDENEGDSESSAKSVKKSTKKKISRSSEEPDDDDDESVEKSINTLNKIPLRMNQISEPEPSLLNKQQNGLSDEQMKMKLLYKIDAYKRDGCQLKREYTLDSDLDDIKIEIQCIEEKLMKKKQKTYQQKKVEEYRKKFIYTITALEYANTFNTKFPLQLNGWSEHMKNDIRDETYTDIFEDLQEKYEPSTEDGKSSTAPEIRLLWAIAASGVMFHIGGSLPKLFDSQNNNTGNTKKKIKKMKGPSDFDKFEEEMNNQFKKKK
jgi:hypothetical protein